MPIRFHGEARLILLDQARTLDRTRPVKRLGAASSATLAAILQTLQDVFAP